jgi:hypothetical protein
MFVIFICNRAYLSMKLFGLILLHCFIKIFYTVAQSFLVEHSVSQCYVVHHYLVADKSVYGFGVGT